MSSILINNSWQNGSGERFESLNPANQQVIWQGNFANTEQVEKSIKSARSAFKSWSKLSFEHRQDYIKKYIDVLKTNQEAYAKVISQEMGKPLWEAKSEVATMMAKYDASVAAYQARTGTVNNVASTGINSILTHRAIGVMVVFGPFNFPGHLPNGHILPALLAGNTVVFKPSDQTPLCGELMVKYWIEAGLPEGVISLVHGGPEVGKALVANTDINGVLFTGSYPVGKIIHQQLAGRVDVMLALEMGGNNPLIVDNDINNLSAAVYNTVQSAFITSGQRCTCARRLYIPNSDFGKKFLDKLVDVTNNIAISDGVNNKNLKNTDPFMGPVVSLKSAQNILKFKNNLLANSGAQELAELKLLNNNSALLTPGIILNKNSNNLSNLDSECFGPLLQIFYYDDFHQAIDAANNTQYGLAAGLLSDNKKNFERFYNQIKAGIVNWNRPTTGAAGSLPFGGVGHSGNYRPSAAYAADYCSYPMATQYSESNSLPETLTPGIVI